MACTVVLFTPGRARPGHEEPPVQIGVPLVAGTDPLPLAILDRMAAQANAELALAGDPRGIEVVRIAAEPSPVKLWGGTMVRPDALYRESPGVDVLVIIGPAEPDAAPARDVEAALGFIERARRDAQHVIGVGEGVHWLMQTHGAAGRRVVMNHIAPSVRARYDATLPAHTDPARDGDLWTASDPPRLMLLLLEFFAELGGFELPDRIQMRMPWMSLIVKAFVPGASEDPDDDEDGIAVQGMDT